MAGRIVQLLDKDDNLIFPYAVSLNDTEETEWFTVRLTPENSNPANGEATTITSKNGKTYTFYPFNGGTGWMIEDPSKNILTVRVRCMIRTYAEVSTTSFRFQGTTGANCYIYTEGKQDSDGNISLQYDARSGTESGSYPGVYYYSINTVNKTIAANKNPWYTYEITRRGADLTNKWFGRWNWRSNNANASGMGTIEIPDTGDCVPGFYYGYLGVSSVSWYEWIAEIEEKK